MQNNLFNQENYLQKAIAILKVREDAEDAIQGALLRYIEGKDSIYKNDNPELIIDVLLDKECEKINEKRHRDKTEEYDTFNVPQKMAVDSVYFGFNEGSSNYDMGVLLKNKDAIKSYFEVKGEILVL